MRTIDINCDMGESFGNYIIGDDAALMPYISSCNIACGFHGGDPLHILKTLTQAKKFDVRVGAHPGYPDLNGFGRRSIALEEAELHALILYQVSALMGMATSIGVKVAYVKPHGALYNEMAQDQQLADTVIQAIRQLDGSLAIMGLAGSRLAKWVKKAGMKFIAEGFADRTYDDRGRLLSRTLPDAIIEDPEIAAQQAISIAYEAQVKTNSGSFIPMIAESICIHGDNKNALKILKKIRKLKSIREQH